MEHLYIVDENDEILGTKPRHEVTSSDRCRIVLLWVMNDRGEILLVRRAHSKKTFPGLWSYAVTGAVSHPETYDEAIIREMEEELGIKGFEPVPSIKMKRDFNEGKCIGQSYTLTIPHDYKIVPDQEEVAEVKWVDKKTLHKILESEKDTFVHRFAEEVEMFLP